MVDGLALCSCACVTCLWCSLLFPEFLKKLRQTDSSECVCPIETSRHEKPRDPRHRRNGRTADREPSKRGVTVCKKKRPKKCVRREENARRCPRVEAIVCRNEGDRSFSSTTDAKTRYKRNEEDESYTSSDLGLPSRECDDDNKSYEYGSERISKRSSRFRKPVAYDCCVLTCD